MRRLRIIAVLLVLPILLWAGIANGSKDVSAAGTREALSSAGQAVVWVTIQAKCANTGSIYVGGSAVSSSNGIELRSCDSFTTPALDFRAYYDLSRIYIDSSVSGEGVTFAYMTRP